MTYLTRVHSPSGRDHFDVIVLRCFSARLDWYLGFSHRGRDCTSCIVPMSFICATEEVHPTKVTRVNTR